MDSTINHRLSDGFIISCSVILTSVRCSITINYGMSLCLTMRSPPLLPLKRDRLNTFR
ncbi:MAG: hypothetical protein AAGD25_03135 [Cyanobacteria bacterium P01_F01_bin.150]